ncbi:MAG: 3-deoxy-D-manno-octulosonic-acid transferase [Bacteroidetes bacterium]|nr:MAG: 3-deoxy-D-manno-octulosonic-acid transferase [Bacteroidota bacterium]
MRGLYTFNIYLFRLAVFIAGIFNKKARLWQQGRKNLFEQLRANFKTESPVAWFHCASLGEFEQGRPLMEAFRKKHPDYKIILTFFSPSGYAVRKNYPGADYVCYLPLDTPSRAKRFLATVKPAVVFFIKYEFWYNFLYELREQKIPHYLVSGIFRPSQPFFRSYGNWFRRALHGYAHIFTQDENSLKLLKEIGIHRASISGDTRFDRVAEIAANAKEIPLAKAFQNNRAVFIAGSTWPADEEILYPLIAGQLSDEKNGIRKFMLVPHEISETHIENIIRSLEKNGGTKAVRFSQTTEAQAAEASVLIIDNIGMLSALYRYGTIGYIGGGFGAGIHNTLEAAVYGMPVFFGPNYRKFIEARGLIAAGAAFSISNAAELEQKFSKIAGNENVRLDCAARARFVSDHGGATAIILAQLGK